MEVRHRCRAQSLCYAYFYLIPLGIEYLYLFPRLGIPYFVVALGLFYEQDRLNSLVPWPRVARHVCYLSRGDNPFKVLATTVDCVDATFAAFRRSSWPLVLAPPKGAFQTVPQPHLTLHTMTHYFGQLLPLITLGSRARLLSGDHGHEGNVNAVGHLNHILPAAYTDGIFYSVTKDAGAYNVAKTPTYIDVMFHFFDADGRRRLSGGGVAETFEEVSSTSL